MHGKAEKGWLCLVILLLGLLLGRPGSVMADPTSTYTPSPRPTQYAGGCSLPFNPCGPLPFPVPQFATIALPSPTAIATLPTPTPVPITATPTFTETPTNTLTPTATNTGTQATIQATIAEGGEQLATLADSLGSQAKTLSAIATNQIVLNGTPTGIEEIAGKMGQYAGWLIAIVRGFSGIDSFSFGAFTFLLAMLLFMFAVTVVTLLGSILLLLLKWTLSIWTSVKPF